MKKLVSKPSASCAAPRGDRAKTECRAALGLRPMAVVHASRDGTGPSLSILRANRCAVGQLLLAVSIFAGHAPGYGQEEESDLVARAFVEATLTSSSISVIENLDGSEVSIGGDFVDVQYTELIGDDPPLLAESFWARANVMMPSAITGTIYRHENQSEFFSMSAGQRPEVVMQWRIQTPDASGYRYLRSTFGNCSFNGGRVVGRGELYEGEAGLDCEREGFFPVNLRSSSDQLEVSGWIRMRDVRLRVRALYEIERYRSYLTVRWAGRGSVAGVDGDVEVVLPNGERREVVWGMALPAGSAIVTGIDSYVKSGGKRARL